MERQVKELNARSFKFYNAHIDGKSWRCDDENVACPISACSGLATLFRYYGRALDPPDRALAHERAVRRTRSGRRPLGRGRLADRDLQAQRRRSPGDPEAYLASTLTRLINRHPASQIDQLMPWTYADHAG
jgi:IS66 C-terminal element